ncbi:MAG: hypothetical protein LBB88_06270 [Planctomycetaceae bacterium]|jgi:hypothetical protein|nr:hypothetical protein [Planctomycetaceae bacterium]
MSEVKKIDYVLQEVINSAQSFGLITDGPIGQQILLLGDTFYGYRFTANEFTAVWSVSDQVLNIFDSGGKRLGSSVLKSSHDNITTMESQLIIPNQNERNAA